MPSTVERTSLDVALRQRRPTRLVGLAARVPLLLAVVVVAMRLPWAGAAPGADEAGFLMVARQWHPGSSLYGDYWVDRPPLLISIFRLAALLGGLVPLRVIGALAAALVVLGAARVARQVVPPEQGLRASAYAAVIAAALCVSPLTGSAEVNGELLAAPFVVWGISALLAALTPGRPLQARAGFTLAAGAAGAAAVLVKQNFLDVAVVAATLLVLAVVRRELSAARALRVAGGLAAGAAGCVAVVAGWTLLHGTSLVGVYGAMYPFRLAAARAMAASGNPAPAARLTTMLTLLALSLAPVLVACATAALASRRLGGTATWAIVALLTYDAVSIWAGGNYWSHYLVQLVVPVAVLGGAVVAAGQPGARVAVAGILASALVGWSVGMPPATSTASSLGRAVGAASHPGDSIVTIYGHSDVSLSSGLTSPYPYLWSLPLKVRDPHERLLGQVLAGPDAPTWLVTWSTVSSVGVDATGTQRLLEENYQPVAVLKGHTVYLHDGISRPTPTLTHEGATP